MKNLNKLELFIFENKITLYEKMILNQTNIKENEIFINEKINKNNPLYYFELGKNNKRNLILIHGYAASGITFYRMIEQLQKYFHLYVIDIIGFGKSYRPEFNFDNIKDCIDFILEPIIYLINQIIKENVFLAGHSFGGYICTELLNKLEDKVVHIFLLSPGGFTDKDIKIEDYLTNYQKDEFLLHPDFNKINEFLLNIMNEWIINKKKSPFEFIFGYLTRKLLKYYFKSNKFNFNNIEKKLFVEYFDSIYELPISGDKIVGIIFKFGGYSKYPIIDKINLENQHKFSIFFGDKDWLDLKHAKEILNERNLNPYFEILKDSSHQVIFDCPKYLSKYIIKKINNLTI